MYLSPVGDMQVNMNRPNGKNATTIWSTGTTGKGNTFDAGLGFGLFVYDSIGNSVWSAGVNSKVNHVQIQDSGQAVAYDDGNNVVWSTHSDTIACKDVTLKREDMYQLNSSDLFTDDEVTQILANPCLISHPQLSTGQVALAGDTGDTDANLIDDGSGANAGDVVAANPADGRYEARLNFNWPLTTLQDVTVFFADWNVNKTLATKGTRVGAVAMGLDYLMFRTNGQWNGNVQNVKVLSGPRKEEADLKGLQLSFVWMPDPLKITNGDGKGVYSLTPDGMSSDVKGATWRAQTDATLNVKVDFKVGPIGASANFTVDKLTGAEVVLNGNAPTAHFTPNAIIETYTITKTPCTGPFGACA
jgi:hypothetical protein